ncbi:MAG: hypothetical protein AAF962_10505 [Actinomycetota bacterium]
MKKVMLGFGALLLLVIAAPLAVNAQGGAQDRTVQDGAAPTIEVVYLGDGVTVDDGATYAGVLAWVQWWLGEQPAPPADTVVPPTTAPDGDPGPPTTAPTTPPTPTTEPPGTTPVDDDGVAFFEDFAGADSFERFDVGIFHRDDFVNADNVTWPGDHAVTGPGDLCGPPEDKRTIDRGERGDGFNTEWVYRCVPGGDVAKAHLMTSIGDTSGYSIGAFTPTQTFTGVREVRWDVNITELGNRQFPEIKVIPADRFDFQDLPCSIEWFPCETSTHAQLGSVGVSFQNHELSINNGVDNEILSDQWGGPWLNPDDPAVDSIRMRRTHVFRDNGDGTLSFSIEQADGTFLTVTREGGFPTGPVRVVFADHNYTPLKAENGTPETFTWHWDDITVIVDG